MYKLSGVSEDVQNLVDRARKHLTDIEAEAAYLVDSAVVKPKHRSTPENIKRDKVLSGALAGLSSLAATSTLPPLLARTKVPWKIRIPMAIGTTVVGYSMPNLANKVLDEREGLSTPELTRKEFQKAYKLRDDVVDKVKSKLGIKTDVKSLMTKSAALPKVVGPLTSGATKGAIGLGSAIGRSLTPKGWGRYYGKMGKKVPLGVSAFKWGVRGGVGLGAISAATKVHQKITAPKSGRDYTTLLRNNILAGNIKPHELSPADLVSVQRLGLR